MICAFGRLGHWFGAERFGYVPDLITFAKGLTGAHFSMGGVLISDRVAEPVPRRPQQLPARLSPSAATRSAPRSRWRRSRRSRARACSRTCAPTSRSPARRSNGLRDIPIVGDVRGAGHFWAIELVRDQETRASFDGPAADWLLKDVLSEELWSRGLICRLDDRTEPIIQIAPPLVADADLIEEIASILREGLEVATERMAERPELTGVG